MKTKFFILSLALFASSSIFAQTSGTCGSNLTWNLTNGVLTISGSGDMTNYSSSNGAPWYPLNSTITKAIINNSVTSIGNYAFTDCSSLTSVTIGNGVTSIGNSAFSNCSGLTSITIPNSVTSIGGAAFYGCNGLTSPLYNSHVFAYMPTSYSGAYTIPSGIESIVASAFYNCNNLTSVIIPNSVTTSLGSWTFSGCSRLTSVTIGNGVTSIGNSVFSGCSRLSAVTIGNNVRSIGEHAFSNCSGLTSITIPDSVTNIGNYAFSNCNGLTSVTIPNSVTRIGERTFSNCSSLSSVTIGNGVTSIGNSAFDGCNGLTSIIIPNSVMSIGEYAFYNCSGLKSVTIRNGVTSIGNYAFSGCNKLTSINIPNSVTNIGDDVFSGCQKITSPLYNSHVFAYMPTSYSGAYTIPNGIEKIASSAFKVCSALTSVTLPNSVTTIGSWTFSSCRSLTSVTIPNSVTSIGEYAFYNCSGLTSVTIGNGVTSIGKNVFSNCSGLTSVTIPNSVTRIGERAFSNCNGLTSVTIPNSITRIGESAFSNCSGLTSITIPNSVTSIGGAAFYGCSILNTICLESTTPPQLGNQAFFSTSSSLQIIVFCSALEAFQNAENWSTYTDKMVIAPSKINGFPMVSGTGYVRVPQTSCEDTIEAVSAYGYHFAQWTDGNTDNPRIINDPNIDTTYIAEFAINQYRINVSCDDTCGYIEGGNEYYNYLTTQSFEAIAKYGYHFTKWSDGVKTNPRTIVLTQDTTFVAEFAFNQYSINVSCDKTYGHIEGENGSFDYLTTQSFEAIANYGFHFLQWSDSVTDNPRTIVLTQDTSFVAEFAFNQYSINVSCNQTYGHVEGESGAFDYRTVRTYEAIANYGYHFTKWSDGVTSNPRTITITRDQNIEALFGKNSYTIVDGSNRTMGRISGVRQVEYLDSVTLTATPNYGYHFTQWSDNVTDNPRTIVLTQDTTFIAEFGVDKSGTCGKDNLLRWDFSADSTFTISGSGELTDNYTYGVEAKTKMKTLVIGNEVTAIGGSAFYGCNNLTKVEIYNLVTWCNTDFIYRCCPLRTADLYINGTKPTRIDIPDGFTKVGAYTFMNCKQVTEVVLPSSVTEIGAGAFAGGSRLQTITLGESLETIGDSAFANCPYLLTVNANMAFPPVINTSVFANCGLLSGIDCYVPTGSLALYQKTLVWADFNLHEKGTDLKSTQALNNATQTQKIFENGQLYFILPDGTKYSATGKKVE